MQKFWARIKRASPFYHVALFENIVLFSCQRTKITVCGLKVSEKMTFDTYIILYHNIKKMKGCNSTKDWSRTMKNYKNSLQIKSKKRKNCSLEDKYWLTDCWWCDIKLLRQNNLLKVCRNKVTNSWKRGRIIGLQL